MTLVELQDNFRDVPMACDDKRNETHSVHCKKWETVTYPVISGYFPSYFWIFILLDTYPAISGLISKTG